MAKPATKIAAATGTAGAGSMGLAAKGIEDAMAKAAAECHRKGITDDEEVREAKLAARAKFKRDHAAREAKAQREAARKARG